MSEVIIFEDQNFENLIREKTQIFDRPITIDDAKKVKDLDVDGILHQIKSLKGIEHFTELEELSINNCMLEKGIATLKNADKLKYLRLVECGLENASGIENFKELMCVDLSYNNLDSAQELGNITTLEAVKVSGNKIKDVKFCKKLKDLKELDIGENCIESLEGLEDSNQLEYLLAYKTRITDVSVIGKLENLEVLDLSNNENIKDFSPLGLLKKIEELNLMNCELLNLNFLKPIKTLSELSIDANNLIKVDINENFKNLKKLEIKNEGLKCNLVDYFGKFISLNNLEEVIIHDVGHGYKNQYTIDEYIQIEQVTDRIVNEINNDWTELEKARYIYERLGQTITYDHSGNPEYYSKDEVSSKETQERGEKTRNLYGPLVEGKAVCVGYAKAFSHICEKVGIKCKLIHGEVPEIEDGLHTWNVINIDGKWHYCDLTWDSRKIKQGLDVNYFCKSENTMEKNHRLIPKFFQNHYHFGKSYSCEQYCCKEDISDELIKAAEMKVGIRSCNDKINQFERERFNNGFDMTASMNKDIFAHNKVSQRTDEIRAAI